MVETKIDPEKKSDEEIRRLLTKTYKDLLEKLPNAKQYNFALTNILNDTLVFDIAFSAALHELESKDTNEIIELTDTNWLITTKNKISKIFFLDNLVLASGLVKYREKIVNNFIDNVFPGNKETSKPNTKNLLNSIKEQFQQGESTPKREVKPVREKNKEKTKR